MNILNRFGINPDDNHEYTFLVDKENYDSKLKKQAQIFIFIHKYKKCIEINFNNSKIDINNCFIFNNKENKHKLLFNLTKDKYPFIYIIPSSAPYLCYEINNEYYLEFILSRQYRIKSKTAYEKDFENYVKVNDTILNDEKSRTNFLMYTIKIEPSMIFPSLATFNKVIYNYLFEFYYNQKIILDNESLKIFHTNKNFFNLTQDINSQINIIISNIKKCITCNDCDIDKFEDILNTELLAKESRSKIYESFIYDNRLCTSFDNSHLFKKSIGSNTVLKNVLQELIDIRNNRILIKLDTSIKGFILNNINIWILLMEVNILINLFNTINPNISCWDIEFIITSLESIQNFNSKKLMSNYYYNFEITSFHSENNKKI